MVPEGTRKRATLSWKRAAMPRTKEALSSGEHRGDDQLSASRKVLRHLWPTSYYTLAHGVGYEESGRRSLLARSSTSSRRRKRNREALSRHRCLQPDVLQDSFKVVST